jgi:hypothetical protein
VLSPSVRLCPMIAFVHVPWTRRKPEQAFGVNGTGVLVLSS